MTEIAIEELKLLCEQVLTKNNFRQQDCDIIIDHLIENECSGKSSHGMVRLVEIISTVKRLGVPQHDVEIDHDQGNILTLDAKAQIGLVAGYVALNHAMLRAKEHGLSMVGVRNYIATSGSMAFYLRKIAAEGLVAIMGCNSVALVAPPEGKKRMIGTNPIGVCIPGKNGEHLIADLATSSIAYGKIMVAKDKGEDIPEGVLIDEDGNPSTNPKDAYDGAILPLAGYKGFGLGLMVELMAGPLIGAKAVKENDYDGDGLFIIAIDPNQFGNNHYYEEISDALSKINQSPSRNGEAHVSIPGERSERILSETVHSGIVNVAEKTLNKIRMLEQEG